MCLAETETFSLFEALSHDSHFERIVTFAPEDKSRPDYISRSFGAFDLAPDTFGTEIVEFLLYSFIP